MKIETPLSLLAELAALGTHGVKEELLKKCNPDQALAYEVVTNMKTVDYRVTLTKGYDFWMVIDTVIGRVARFNEKHYVPIIEGRHLILESKKTGVRTTVYDGNEIDYQGLCHISTGGSSHGPIHSKSVRHKFTKADGNRYDLKLKMHVIVAAVRLGYAVLACIGEYRTHEVHHLDHNHTNNNVDNLTILTISEHRSYHAKNRKKKAVQRSLKDFQLAAN